MRRRACAYCNRPMNRACNSKIIVKTPLKGVRLLRFHYHCLKRGLKDGSLVEMVE